MSAASFSKVAFAYLAMELVDEGKLDLDKPVYQYLAQAACRNIRSMPIWRMILATSELPHACC